MDSSLLAFFYLYGVGGTLFTGSLFFLVRKKALDPDTREDRRFLILLILGYLAFVAYHAFTQFILPGNGG